jgi:hypothetical protein
MKALDLFVHHLVPEGSGQVLGLLRPYSAWTINQEGRVEVHGSPTVRVPLIQKGEGNPEEYARTLLLRAAECVRQADTVQDAEWSAQRWIPDRVKSVELDGDPLLVVPDGQVLGHYVLQFQFWGLIILGPVYAFRIGPDIDRFSRPEVL